MDEIIEKLAPQVKAEWVAALRSGKYEQGTDHLIGHDDAGGSTYCCLGVLCAINPEIAAQVASFDDLKHDQLLVDSEDAAVLISRDAQQMLAEYNDAGRSFNDIADIIERNSSI